VKSGTGTGAGSSPDTMTGNMMIATTRHNVQGIRSPLDSTIPLLFMNTLGSSLSFPGSRRRHGLLPKGEIWITG
jgi:hypothetical protein